MCSEKQNGQKNKMELLQQSPVVHGLYLRLASSAFQRDKKHNMPMDI